MRPLTVERDTYNNIIETGYFTINNETVNTKTVLTEILAEKYKSKNITVNSFHPGIVKGNLSRNMPFLLQGLFKIAKPFMSAISKNGVYVCLSEKLENVSGKLIVNKK